MRKLMALLALIALAAYMIGNAAVSTVQASQERAAVRASMADI